MVEIYFNVQSDNGSITDQHALRRWSTQFMRALEDRKELRIGSRLKGLLESGGLVEVDARMIPLPLSAWPSGMSSSTIPGGTTKPDLTMQIRECKTLVDPTPRISKISSGRWRCIRSRNACTCRRRILIH